MSISAAEIDAVCSLVRDLCGVYLDASKSYLIETRLNELLRLEGCANYHELVERVRRLRDPATTERIVDSITTHETLFFRDRSPFEALQHKAIPELVDVREKSAFPRRLRIWSAACSTGQEAYSIAMTLCELIPDIATWNVTILGTDVSDESVRRASRGWYAPHEIERGLDPGLLRRYFEPFDGGWRVADRLRGMVCFRRANLLKPLSLVGKQDVIFCRNVAIYFTPEDRKNLFLRLKENLAPDGYLFVGSSESLRDVGPEFVPHNHCRAVFYRPNLTSATARV